MSHTPWPLTYGLRGQYRWTAPGTWQRNWTASCRICRRLFDVPADFYESLESTGLLIDHYKSHLGNNHLQERES
jgi:hypothetical protein